MTDTKTRQVSIKPEIKASIENAAEKFRPLSLKEAESLSLMSRYDAKFLANVSLIPEILNKVSGFYHILNVDNIRCQEYRSSYYDTPDFSMYLDHHNGKARRYKVRIREYLSSGIAFLEIKVKNNKGFTFKKREDWVKGSRELTDHKAFIEKLSPYKTEDLKLVVDLRFYRITLLGLNTGERITIDYGIEFNDHPTLGSLPSLSVIEVKSASNGSSEMQRILSEMGIKPGSFSKYCTGVVLNFPKQKTNQFKTTIRKINSLDYDPSTTL